MVTKSELVYGMRRELERALVTLGLLTPASRAASRDEIARRSNPMADDETLDAYREVMYQSVLNGRDKRDDSRGYLFDTVEHVADARRTVDAIRAGSDPATLRKFEDNMKSTPWKKTDLDEAPAVIRDLILDLGPITMVEPWFLAKVIRIESNFDPLAVSPTGAKGLGQITTPALRQYERAHSYAMRGSLFDPSVNIEVTAWYLRWVASVLYPLKVSKGMLGDDNWSQRELARVYAGYNIGVGSVKDLASGNPSARTEKLISLQSRALARDGASGYLDNVERHLT